MLPRVLCVYWGFHSWWCSRQRGGLHGLLDLAISPERMSLTPCVSVCVGRPITEDRRLLRSWTLFRTITEEEPYADSGE